MLFCPYCLKGQELSHEGKDFTDVAGFYLDNNSSKKKMMLKIHSQGCGRVFVAISAIFNRGLREPQADP